ncbi:MAG: cyclophilin-like fold protein [Candidatus Brocadiia bacterium]
MPSIRIQAGSVQTTAQLNDTPTAQKVLEALPIDSTARLWGQEVYFETPVRDEERDAQAEVPSGTVAYWPPGHALCLFFGEAPASPVNVVGALDGDPQELAKVQAGDSVRVEKAD